MAQKLCGDLASLIKEISEDGEISEELLQELDGSQTSLENLFSHPILPDSLKQTLVERAQEGDERCKNALTCAYMAYGRKVAKKYANSSDELEDLAQEAALILMKAVEKFDSSRGVPFTSYVAVCMKQLASASRKSTLVHIPEIQITKRNQLKRIMANCGHDIVKASELMGEDVDKMRALLHNTKGISSLDKVVGEGSTTILDFQGEDTTEEHLKLL
ncbi:MAG: sigma factor, partial [Candidatus Nanoarchaeia archaeon]